MIWVNRSYQHVRVSAMLVLLIGLAPLTITAAEEQLTDLKPLVGKWRGHITSAAGTSAVDLTIKEDGTYIAVIYIRPPLTVPGTMHVVDGKARFTNSEGKTGTFTLNVDGKGERVLKGVRDDGINTTEYEPVK